MYMNHLYNKHDEWLEERQGKRESYKKGRSQRTRDCENSNGRSGSVKCLTMYSQMQYILYTYCIMSKADITKIIVLYNQSN